MNPAVRRTLLFTPANRPAAFDKGLASGTDCLCLDLEDAVPPDAKAGARPGAVDFLAGGEAAARPERVLRINAVSTMAGLEDLAAVARKCPSDGVVLLPKTANPEQIRLIEAILNEAGSGARIGALIETAEGLERASEIARASSRMAFLLFGAVDLSAELGCAFGSHTMNAAASRVLLAARGAGIDALDAPELGFRDLDAVAAAASRACANGFTGKAAIHPSNIDAINRAFTPSAGDITEAKEIVAAYDAAPNGLAVIDGRLIELPVVRAMQRRLALAAAAGSDR